VRMVEGLLQVAKLEAGTSEMARDAIDPAALLQAAAGALEVQAAASEAQGVRGQIAARKGQASGAAAEALAALDQAASPQEWNVFLLSSPEFMLR